MKALIVLALCLIQLVIAGQIYSHAELHFNEGKYGDLNSELREWLESEKESVTQYTKRIAIKE